MQARLLTVGLFLLLGTTALIVAGPTGAQDDDVAEVTATSTIKFEPDSLKVDVGTTVRWVWEGGGRHTVTSSDSIEFGKRVANGLFDGEIKAEGDVFEFTFDEAGEFPYFCQPHTGADMIGTIIVEEASSPTNDGESDGASNDAPGPMALLVVGLIVVAIAAIRRY